VNAVRVRSGARSHAGRSRSQKSDSSSDGISQTSMTRTWAGRRCRRSSGIRALRSNGDCSAQILVVFLRAVSRRSTSAGAAVVGRLKSRIERDNRRPPVPRGRSQRHAEGSSAWIHRSHLFRQSISVVLQPQALCSKTDQYRSVEAALVRDDDHRVVEGGHGRIVDLVAGQRAGK
jgi:hypothetical protein